jgi:diguanylate cyclase (GGDEF)-like protein
LDEHDEGAPSYRRERSRPWIAAAWAILVAGTLVALGGSIVFYGVARGRDRQTFRTGARSVTAAVVAAIGRDGDFVAAQEGLFATFPHLTNVEYRHWYDALGARARYPGGLGFFYLEKVRAARLRGAAMPGQIDLLADGAARRRGELGPRAPARTTPSCVVRLGIVVGATRGPTGAARAASVDLCAPSGPLAGLATALARATASGMPTVAPPSPSDPSTFYIVAPVQRAGSVRSAAPAVRQDGADSAVRVDGVGRAVGAGWAVGAFDGPVTLHWALGDLRQMVVRLGYVPTHGPAVTVASVGTARGVHELSSSAPAGLGGRWRIVVTGGTATPAALQATVLGLLVEALGVVTFLLLQLLARSRERALRLVDERTGELRHQALHDALTGLPNRALIVDRVGQVIARASREPLAIGVLFVDLDNFKDINDSFGHHHGDELLRAVAVRLRTALRPSDSVGRLGGDEFVVLVGGSSLDAGPELVAERVLEVLREPFSPQGLGGIKLSVRASIGLAVGTRASADELLRDADVALYQAKQAGGDRYMLFHPEMQVAVQERLALEMDLRVAVETGQLFVEYQPTFDLQDLAMTGVEALVRWSHPTRGLVGPDEFVPVAEQSGLVCAIGRLVLTTSCNQAAAWLSAGSRVPVSVNVSGRQLESDQLGADVADALASSGLDPTMLTLELTETVLMRDADATKRRLAELKRLGVQIAIDDFGTGYSSLAYLRQFPVDALKIDRSFIAGIARSEEARTLIHTLVQLGKTLGLRTVAEGVEDAAQLAELQREQCDHGQGFYYSRPIPSEAVEALFAAGAPAASGSGTSSEV